MAPTLMAAMGPRRCIRVGDMNQHDASASVEMHFLARPHPARGLMKKAVRRPAFAAATARIQVRSRASFSTASRAAAALAKHLVTIEAFPWA